MGRTRGPKHRYLSQWHSFRARCSAARCFCSRYMQVQSSTPRFSHCPCGSPFALSHLPPLHVFVPTTCLSPSCDSPSASRGLQCPEGSQGMGEEALKAYCTRTLPSTHRSHADPTSLGGQENRKTHQLSNS